MQPDAGEIFWDGERMVLPNPEGRALAASAWCSSISRCSSNLTVAENVALGLPARFIAAVLERARGCAGLRAVAQSEAEVSQLRSASGNASRSSARSANPKLLILDEPTSVLTPQEVDQLFVCSQLAKEGARLLYIATSWTRSNAVRHSDDPARRKMVATCDPRVRPRVVARKMIGGAEIVEEAATGCAPRGRGSWSPARWPGTRMARAQGNSSRARRRDRGYCRGRRQRPGRCFRRCPGKILGGRRHHHRGERPASSTPTSGASRGRHRSGGTAGLRRCPLHLVRQFSAHRPRGVRLAMGFIKPAASTCDRRRDLDLRQGRARPAPSRALFGRQLYRNTSSAARSCAARRAHGQPADLGRRCGCRGDDSPGAGRSSARGAAIVVISQDLDELAEIADRIAVMFHGRLSAPLEATEATREKLGLLMGGANPERLAEEREAKHAVGA